MNAIYTHCVYSCHINILLAQIGSYLLLLPGIYAYLCKANWLGYVTEVTSVTKRPTYGCM